MAGHRGMLGHVVARYFAEQGHAVRTSDARYTGAPRDALIEAICASDARCVLNCLGRVPQRGAEPGDLERSNARFPLQLAARLRPDQLLIHASSDGVFAGTRGGYRVDEEPDAKDAYGASKRAAEGVAERPNAVVVRCSMVGPDPIGRRGLLAWFLAQPSDAPVPGDTNHFWNGITTLEWARIAEELITRWLAGGSPPRIEQPGTEVISKYDLLCAFRDVWATSHRVHPVVAPQGRDLSLVPTSHRGEITELLRGLAEWSSASRPISVPRE
ncbi:MAG: sugar nucleotide-binding protein [Gemmatimonadaceae bacterium]